jgi:hypothetical protein
MSVIGNSHRALLSALEAQAKSAAEQQRQFEEGAARIGWNAGLSVSDWRSAVRAKGGFAKLDALSAGRNAWRAALSRLKPTSSYEAFCEQVADWSVEQLHAERDLLRRARS